MSLMYHFWKKTIACIVNQFLQVICLKQKVSIILVIEFPRSEDNDETLPEENDGDSSSWLFSTVSTWHVAG